MVKAKSQKRKRGAKKKSKLKCIQPQINRQIEEELGI